ncbi:MAG: hypothetical protein JWO60_2915, partial [Frankiales bacterium]|nr:hypothetical protein [Frankiales bacterium]
GGGSGAPPSGPPSFGRPPGAGPGAAPGGFGTRPPAPPAAGGFGDRPGGSVLPEAPEPVSAPVGWLGFAGGLEAVALVLAAVAHDRPVLAVAAWLLAGFGAIGALALFTVKDARRRAEPWYSPSASAGALRVALAVAAVLVVALASYQFADWLARR